tara:strand:- start:1851 stop:2201 length:351 start_codon:yes stop_codon:yes gene_type:complete
MMPGTAPMESEAFEAMFGPIRARFRLSMAEHVAHIERILQGGAGLGAPRALEDVAVRAHKISGVAATLGFDGIGRSATTVENGILTLQRAAAYGASDLASLHAMIRELVDRMQAEI